MSRFNLRRKPRISYYEVEEPNLDEYIYCDECTDFVYEYCAIHGPLLVVPDKKVTDRAGIPPWVPRAALTTPKEFVHIAPSYIPGAGLGVFSTLTLPRGVRFGPYQGKHTPEIKSTYCWQIKSPDLKNNIVVDAGDGETSNWLRYVNCSRNWREQNLVAFQYRGQMYYRTIKIVPRFTELLVFYGSEFASALGVDLRRYNAPPAAQYGALLAKKPAPATHKHEKRVVPTPATDKNRKKLNENVIKENISTTLNNKGAPPSKRRRAVIQKKLEKHVTAPVTIENRRKIIKEDQKEHNITLDSNNGNNSTTITEKYNCNDCGKSFQDSYQLNIHVKSHSLKSNIYFDCKVCDYRCVTRGTLEKHLQMHDKKRSFACNICKRRFITIDVLKIHLRTHTGEKPYQCDICEYRCNGKGVLKRHLRTHTGEKPYQCDICEYRCNQKGHLKRHLRTHTGEKPYQCDICEYRCNQKSALKRHLRTHTGEKPYQCDICEYRCNQKDHLKIHLRTHTGEKPYQCDICEYRCNQKSDLKRHLRTHTGEKPYECNICEYRCNQKSDLKRHLRTHTGEKPYECNICEKRFTRSGNLNEHLRIHTR